MKRWYKILPVIAIILAAGAFALYAHATNLGPKLPTSAVDQGDGDGWLNPTNIEANDGTPATGQLFPTGVGATGDLYATGFGFAVPTNATVTGITVSVSLRASANTGSQFAIDQTIQLLKAGTQVGSNFAQGLAVSTATTTSVYGNGLNLWGTTWTPAQINASTFGVDIGYLEGSSAGLSVYVDYVQITVSYSFGDAKVTVTKGITVIGRGAVSGTATFTSSGTWTAPVGATKANVMCWGAGGGGGGSATTGGGGAGGGGAYSETDAISVTPGTSYPITAGLAGVKGNNSGSSGTTGGDSMAFSSSTVFAKGGSGGIGAPAASAGAGGSGGLSTSGIGNILTSGGTGGNGDTNTDGGSGGGSGGNLQAGQLGGSGNGSVVTAAGLGGLLNGSAGGKGSGSGGGGGGGGGYTIGAVGATAGGAGSTGGCNILYYGQGVKGLIQ